MSVPAEKRSDELWRKRGLSPIPFDGICTPGAYVCVQTGDLVRVSDAGPPLAEGMAPNLVGSEPRFVLRISPDPFVPISWARKAAADLDIEVNF